MSVEPEDTAVAVPVVWTPNAAGRAEPNKPGDTARRWVLVEASQQELRLLEKGGYDDLLATLGE